jgi:UDP-galactopyranose mutase
VKRVHIVGAGITGCALAHFLKGDFEVHVYEKTDKIGGLCRTYSNLEGIPYLHGAHVLHTNEEWIFNLFNSAVDMLPVDYKVAIDPLFDFRYYDFPFTPTSIEIMPWHWRENIIKELEQSKGEHAPNIENLIINYYGETAYKQFFYGWLKKWFSLNPIKLDEARWFKIFLRPIIQQSYFLEKFVCFPINDGYEPLFLYLMNGTNVHFNSIVTYKDLPKDETVICTIKPDEFVEFDKKLKYVQVSFDIDSTQYAENKPDTMIYPNYTPFISATQFGKFFPSYKKNIIAKEFIGGDIDAYPIPVKKYYKIISEIRDAYPQIHFCGRLATYLFADMADCIKQAANVAAKIKHKEKK